ncbi:phage GP46 family protein [Klebsiella pneumoniae]|nr:phage GP46 family protein [Klebsiella pneumoniae]
MIDAALVWRDGRGELVIADGDLLPDSTINTAVLVSYFTDRRAEPGDELPDGSNDRRGWWGDSYRGEPIGSRLWLLGREKSLPDVLNRAAAYARESVQWLIRDGYAKKITVTASSPKKTILQLTTDITLPTGEQLPSLVFTAAVLGI